MGNRKKYIIIGLIILMVLLAAWKLLMLTVFKSYAGASGERKEEPILAVYDYNGQLKSNDLLFIDSSHIIRPQGDVLFEYLELLPTLKPGVLIHVHDIFTPKDYPDEWVYKNHYLWNEQYLLEAFMSFNSGFKIMGALNYLAHNYRNELAEKCPVFAKHEDGEPGAFWMIKQ